MTSCCFNNVRTQKQCSIASPLYCFAACLKFSYVLNCLLFISMILAVFMPGQLYAATPGEVIAGQRQAIDRLESEREELRRRPESVDGMDTKSLIPKIEVPDIGAPCREITDIIISSAPNLADSIKERINKEHTGRCLAVSDIERILAEITKYYIDRGYITTRAYLPPQDLSKGHLNILVLEGVVEKIIIEDDGANSISIENIFPGIEGDLLNLRDLEQGIDQINRLFSNNAQLDIQPGKKAGESIVVVKNQASSPYHFHITVDNQGAESTGKTQTGLFFGGDNLLGYNDSLSLTHRQATPGDSGRENSISDNLNFSLPFGYSTFYAGVIYSEYDSPLFLQSGQEIISNGNNSIFNMRLDRVVYRDQTTRASLSATLTAKESKNYLADQFVSVSSRKLTILDLDSNYNTDFAGGVLSFDIGYAIGLTALGALEDEDDLPDSAAQAQFGKYKAGFYYNRGFSVLSKRASFSSQFSAQKTNDTLYGSEQISIGGIYSVRGFVDNTLTGDDGYYWRNELSLNHPFTIKQQIIPTRFYVGIDTGKVTNHADGVPQGHLTGSVFGLSGNWRGLSWDVFNTRPISLPDALVKEDSETWFRITYSI